MKVTRLKKGYRITLSDSDFGMLAYVVADGIGTHWTDDDFDSAYTPAEKAAYTRRIRKHHHLLAIDEDRRTYRSEVLGRNVTIPEKEPRP